jgi:hypothetical protein
MWSVVYATRSLTEPGCLSAADFAPLNGEINSPVSATLSLDFLHGQSGNVHANRSVE